MALESLPKELLCSILGYFALQTPTAAQLQDGTDIHGEGEIFDDRATLEYDNEVGRAALLAACLTSKVICDCARPTLYYHITLSATPCWSIRKLDAFLRAILQNPDLSALVRVLEIPWIDPNFPGPITNDDKDTELIGMADAITTGQTLSHAQRVGVMRSLESASASAKIALVVVRCNKVRTLDFQQISRDFRESWLAYTLAMASSSEVAHVEARSWSQFESQISFSALEALLWLPKLETFSVDPALSMSADTSFDSDRSSFLKTLHLENRPEYSYGLSRLLEKCPMLEELSVKWTSPGECFDKKRSNVSEDNITNVCPPPFQRQSRKVPPGHQSTLRFS